MFMLRTITIFLAAIINTYMLYQCIMKDQKEIDALTQPPQSPRSESVENTPVTEGRFNGLYRLFGSEPKRVEATNNTAFLAQQ